MSIGSWLEGAVDDVGEVFDDVVEEIPMLGDWWGSNQRNAEKDAKAQQQKIWEEIDKLGGYMPTEDQLTPQYQQLGASQAAGATADPAAIAAQRRALQGLEEIYQGGGMTAADRGALAEGQRQQGAFMRGQREAALQNAQERGMGGGGAGLAALMSGQQQSTSALASQNAQVNLAAQQRALQAMQAAGGMGGQMRGQSFNEASSRGTAADRFTMANTDIANRQADRRTDATRDVYGMRERQTAMRAGQYQKQQDDAERRRQEAEERRQGQASAIQSMVGG
jgi:hypothetical protein